MANSVFLAISTRNSNISPSADCLFKTIARFIYYQSTFKENQGIEKDGTRNYILDSTSEALKEMDALIKVLKQLALTVWI